MAGALAERQLVPEQLDWLPPADPRAIGSRRDLRWINALMFNATIMAWRMRADLAQPPRRVLEIGCGDGSFMLAVLRRMGDRWPGGELVLLDRQSLVSPKCRQAFAALGWGVATVNADAVTWLVQEKSSFELVTANLFLHHFADDALRRLLTEVHRLAPHFIATEPRRGGIALFATHLLRLIGANAVTLHDAAASVRAGFTGRELSALWPGEVLAERDIGPFTHVFSAGARP